MSELDFVFEDNTRSDSSDLGLLKAKTLTAKVMKCDKAWGATYAEDLECQEFESLIRPFYYDLRSVSTNFDPKLYRKYGTY